jgi:hypothetical protein
MTVDELLATLPGVLAAEGLSHVVNPVLNVHRARDVEIVVLPIVSAATAPPGLDQQRTYVCWRSHGAVPDWASLDGQVEE